MSYTHWSVKTLKHRHWKLKNLKCFTVPCSTGKPCSLTRATHLNNNADDVQPLKGNVIALPLNRKMCPTTTLKSFKNHTSTNEYLWDVTEQVRSMVAHLATHKIQISHNIKRPQQCFSTAYPMVLIAGQCLRCSRALVGRVSSTSSSSSHSWVFFVACQSAVSCWRAHYDQLMPLLWRAELGLQLGLDWRYASKNTWMPGPEVSQQNFALLGDEEFCSLQMSGVFNVWLIGMCFLAVGWRPNIAKRE